jgi:hypothetical protein
MEQGDFVKKVFGNDEDKIGIVLDYYINSLGNDFVAVMLPSGEIKTWYAKYVRTISKCL